MKKNKYKEFFLDVSQTKVSSNKSKTFGRQNIHKETGQDYAEGETEYGEEDSYEYYFDETNYNDPRYWEYDSGEIDPKNRNKDNLDKLTTSEEGIRRGNVKRQKAKNKNSTQAKSNVKKRVKH